MNRYAQIALEQHRRHRPLEHSMIDDPIAFFAGIGEEIQADVTSRRDDLLGPIRRDETPEGYRRRSYQALRTAEESVIADHQLFQPESDETDSDPITDSYFRALEQINQAIHSPR